MWRELIQTKFIARLTIGLVGVLAFWDGWDERYFVDGVVGSVLAMADPAVYWRVTLRCEKLGGIASASRVAALVIALIGIVACWNYAIAEPSDPDSAGHMQVVSVPIIYAILAVFIFIPLMLIDLFRTKK